MTKFKNPGVAVDLIVEKDKKILLVRRSRNSAAYPGWWSLPGGMLEYGKETTEQCGARELREETGITAKVEDLKLLGVHSDPKRDPRGHVISISYIVTKWIGREKAGDDADGLYWVLAKEAARMNLAFDHKKVIKHYLKRKK